MFRQRKVSPRPQDPVGFAEKARTVGDIHRDVLRVGAIEDAVGIGQRLALSIVDGDLAFQAKERGELSGRFHERRRDVDTCDAALEACCEVAGWSAETATDI